MCANIDNVKEQHQGEAEGQSMKREREQPSLRSDVSDFIYCVRSCIAASLLLVSTQTPRTPMG